MDLKVPVTENDHSQGSLDAPIVLVQYGDFECPYSAAATVAVKRVQKQLDSQFLYVFRPFPLADIHPHALRAAEAAEAAAAQGKFWPMYDILFQNQDQLKEKNLEYYASQVKLDMERFRTSMKEHEHLDAIETSVNSGRSSGAHGTPTFFINGRFFDNRVGLWEEDILLEAIELALRPEA